MFFRNACGLFSSDRILFISVFRIVVFFFSVFRTVAGSRYVFLDCVMFFFCFFRSQYVFFIFRTAICFSGLGYVFFCFFRSWYVFSFFGLQLNRDMFFWTGLCFSTFFGLWYVFFDWVMFISIFQTAAELQYVFLDWVMFFPLFLVCGMFFSDRS